MWHSIQEAPIAAMECELLPVVRPGTQGGERRSLVAALPCLPRGVQRTPLPRFPGSAVLAGVPSSKRDARALIDSVSTTDRRRRPGRLACSEAPVFLSVTAHARRAALIWWSTRLQGAGAGGSAHPVAEAWVEGTRTSGSGFGAICRPLTDWSQVVGGPTISGRPGLQPCLRLADLALDLENPVSASGLLPVACGQRTNVS